MSKTAAQFFSTRPNPVAIWSTLRCTWPAQVNKDTRVLLAKNAVLSMFIPVKVL